MAIEEKYIRDVDECIVTLLHSFRLLNKQDVINLVGKYDLHFDFKQKYDEIQHKIISHIKNENNEVLYNDIVELAFNPNLDVMDGFFVSYDYEKYKMKLNDFTISVTEFNVEDSVYDDERSYFKILRQTSSFIKLSVQKYKKVYIHDINTKISKVFPQSMICNIEIFFDNGIIYFQTQNSTTFSGLRTVVQNLFKYHFKDENFKLVKPKLYQKLNTIVESKSESISYNSINPITIKLLDIIFELENKKYGFSGFHANDIKFDHQESSQLTLGTRIDAISLYGENLLYHEEVKNKIINRRVILEMSLVIEYNQKINEDCERKHLIEVGMNYDRNYFRIFMKQNNHIDQSVISNAYNALKTMFINSYSSKSLSNIGKILQLIGVKENE